MPRNYLTVTLLFLSFAEASSAQPAPPLVHSALPLPTLDAHFQRTEGWIGADGVHSVMLSPQKTLYLFSDTWIGKVKDNKRTDATIVNNTVVVQEGHGPNAKYQFVVRSDGKDKPTALITPTDSKGWYWLQAGAMVQGKLLLFLPQLEKTDDQGVFGFRSIGLWLGIVDNPLDNPLAWRITQQQVSSVLFTPQRELTFGCALLVSGDYLYIYGTDEKIVPGMRPRHLIVARSLLSEASDPLKWQFFSDGRWQSDFRLSTSIADEMASETSVIYLPDRKQYLLVYTQNGLSAKVRGRLADHPWGPWSRPVTLFECPDVKWDKRIFCYAAKAHAALSQGDTVVLSYVANSFDFWHVARDARLYWPRFVEVKLK